MLNNDDDDDEPLADENDESRYFWHRYVLCNYSILLMPVFHLPDMSEFGNRS